jgi:hypothetical protein
MNDYLLSTAVDMKTRTFHEASFWPVQEWKIEANIPSILKHLSGGTNSTYSTETGLTSDLNFDSFLPEDLHSNILTFTVNI